VCGKMELNAYRDVVLTLSMVNPIAVVCVVPIFVLCQDPRKPPSERGDLMGGSVMVKRRSGLLLYISLRMIVTVIPLQSWRKRLSPHNVYSRAVSMASRTFSRDASAEGKPSPRVFLECTRTPPIVTSKLPDTPWSFCDTN